MEKQEGKNYKWLLLGLLAFTYFLMHSTRQIFNASLPDIKASLPGTSDAQWGFTRTAFLFAYGLAVPLAGIAADMLRRKWWSSLAHSSFPQASSERALSTASSECSSCTGS